MSTEEASWASSPGRRRNMQAIRRTNTNPELAIRRALHAAGYRYRVDFAPEPTPRRRADIVFPARMVAVFIDGCFWHACPEHFKPPRSNQAYWRIKIERNQQRDLETSAQLREAGWTVLRFWEHEDCVGVARLIADAVSTVPAKRSRKVHSRVHS